MKTKIFTLMTLSFLLSFGILSAQTARVQIIHNSADAAADSVDVYLDGSLILDNFAFRNATSFLDVTADAPVSIGIATKNSTSVDDTIFNADVTFAADEKYIVVANGMVSGSGYSPSKPFAFDVFDMAREEASASGETDVVVYHGSTDAPPVDVMEPNAGLQLVDNLSYGEFTTDYLELATSDYSLQVQDETGYSAVAQFSAPLSTLDLADSALVVVASGFLDPAQNSDGPAFGLFAALPEGGELVELPAEDLSKAMVQVIHNSSDAAASTVDIYKNDMILLDDFNFRSASPFVEVTAGTLLDISVQPSSSSDTVGSLAKFTYNLLPDEKYILVATGLVSTSGYDPVKPFDMAVFQRARTEASTSGNTDVLVYHGSTDAPVVDVFESSVPAGTLVDNLAYKSFSSDYLELATADYILDIQDETGSTTVQRYEAGLNELGLSNSALVVLASGFLSPENNSNGAEFGLYVALPSGGELVALPVYTAETVTNINEILLSDQNFAVYPNPVQNQLNIDIQMENAENIQVELYDILGKKVADLSPVNRSYNDLTIRYDVGNLDKGLYFISVTDGNSRVTKKIQIGN